METNPRKIFLMGKENPLTPDPHTEALPSLTSQVGLLCGALIQENVYKVELSELEIN